MTQVVGGGRGRLTGNTDGLAGWPVRGDGGRGQPASSRRWAVQVRVWWAWWRWSVRLDWGRSSNALKAVRELWSVSVDDGQMARDR